MAFAQNINRWVLSWLFPVWLPTLLALSALLAAGSATAAAAVEAGPASAAPVENRFDIWEFRVEGNTQLDAGLIETVVYPFLGPQRLIEDVNAAASSLERAYVDAGYPTIYVDVPEQDVKGGVVTLRVVEGRIGRVRIDGSRYFLPSGIRGQLSSVQQGMVLHVPTMQAELNTINSQSPDLRIVPILKPGKKPGVVDVYFNVKDKNPLHGSLSVNNYNSVNTTESRVAASISYDNLWQQQHSLALQWQVAPENTDEVTVLAATYIAPWFDSKNRVAVYAIDSDSNVASLGDTAVLGKGKIYGARFVMPLPSDRQFVHSLSIGPDYKDYSEIIRLDPANSLQTPISYGLWVLQYNVSQFTASSQTQWSIGANFGIRGVGNSDDEFTDKRNDSYPNFAYLDGSVERTDIFSADWQLLSALHVQVADSPLINNEGFSAGGVHSVRGYYESQALGDNGATLGFEVRTPTLVDDVAALNEVRLLTFIEGAYLRVLEPLPDQISTIHLSSAGIGMVVTSLDSLDLTLDWGYVLEANGTIEQGDSRFNAEMQWKF